MPFRPSLSAACLMLALAASPALAQSPASAPGAPTAPTIAAGGKAVFLTFLNAPLTGAPLLHSPKLSLTINGGRTVRAVMDTGSTGVVVAARLIPNVESLPVIGPGELTYSSSGRIMRGKWVRVPVTIGGTHGTQVTTTPMPVLAVERVDCAPHARRCRPVAAPTAIAMLGVGFARQRVPDTHDAPSAKPASAKEAANPQGGRGRNPFLSLPDMGEAEAPGAMRQAYLVTRRGVWLGLTPDQTAGFSFVKLEKNAAGTDWAALPVCMTLDGRKPPACGTALIDTGVTTMYLTLPPEQLANHTQPNAAGAPALAPGATLRIAFGAPDAPLAYAFKTGDTRNPAAPAGITLVNRPGRVFVNTSVRLLNSFDYLYDAQQGFVGLRRLK